MAKARLDLSLLERLEAATPPAAGTTPEPVDVSLLERLEATQAPAQAPAPPDTDMGLLERLEATTEAPVAPAPDPTDTTLLERLEAAAPPEKAPSPVLQAVQAREGVRPPAQFESEREGVAERALPEASPRLAAIGPPASRITEARQQFGELPEAEQRGARGTALMGIRERAGQREEAEIREIAPTIPDEQLDLFIRELGALDDRNQLDTTQRILFNNLLVERQERFGGRDVLELPPLAFAKGVISGATFGIGGKLITKVERALGIETRRPSSATELLGGIGTLVGTILTGQVIAGKIAKLSKPLQSDLKRLLAIRLGTSGAISAGNSLVQLAAGETNLKGAAANVGISLAAGLVGAIPEHLIPAGGVTSLLGRNVPVGKIANWAGQVSTDLAFDFTTDKFLRGRMKDKSFTEWLFTEEMAQLAPSIIFATRDFTDANFETQRKATVDNIKAKIRADWEAKVQSLSISRAIVPSKPALTTAGATGTAPIPFGKTRPLESQFGIIRKAEGGRVESPTEGEVREAAVPQITQDLDIRGQLPPDEEAELRGVAEAERIPIAETQVAVDSAKLPASRSSAGPLGITKAEPDFNAGTRFDESYDENEAALRAELKKGRDSTVNIIKRLTIDQQASVKDALSRAGAKDAMNRLVLAQGASAEAARLHRDAMRRINTALPRGQFKTFSKFIDAVRTIEATRVQAERGTKLSSRQGVTAENAREWLTEFEQQQPELATQIRGAAEEYWGVMNEQLGSLRDAGLVSQADFEFLSANHRFFSPRQFVQFVDPETQTAKGGRQHDSGIKPLKTGSEGAMVTDPNFLLAQVIGRTQSRVFKNRANAELANFVRDNPDSAVGRIIGPDDALGPNEGEVRAFENGEPVRIAMQTRLAEQWNGVPPPVRQDIANIAQWVSGTKVLKFVATGANPEFALANLARDAFFSWFNSGQYSKLLPKAAMQMGLDYARVAKDAFARTGRYVDYVKEGGGMDYLSTQGRLTGRQWERRSATSKAGQAVQGATRGARATIDSIFDVLAYLGETSEIATRLAVVERARANGLSQTEAVAAARSMLDFSQGGGAVKALDSIVPYLNAAVQGTRGTLRTIKTDPGGSALKAVQLIAMGFASAYGFRSKDKEGWEALSDRAKATHWNIPLGFTKTDKNGRMRHAHISIPKDQGQQLFSAIGQSLADAMDGKPWSKQRTADMARRIWTATSGLLPVEGASSLPPIRNAAMAYWANYDTWTQDKVWKSYEDISPSKEFQLTTPDMAKNLTDTLARMDIEVSPERLARATTKMLPISNPIVSALSDIYDMAADKTANDTAVENMRKVPFVRRLVRFTRPSDVAARTDQRAKGLDIDTTGKTNQEVIQEIKEAARQRNDPRQVNNVELQKFLFSGQPVDSGAVRTWLRENIEGRSEQNRLFQRAKKARPKDVTGKFGGSTKPQSTRSRRKR